jgi:cell division protein FtsI/penicillin-binding protein 2
MKDPAEPVSVVTRHNPLSTPPLAAEPPSSTADERAAAEFNYPLRYLALGLVFAAVALAIVIQLIRLPLSPEAAKLRAQSKLYARELHIFSPPRGAIYDRWGNLMAGNQTVYEVGLDMNAVKDPQSIAFALSKVLSGHPEYDSTDYYNTVLALASSESPTITYRVMADYVTQAEVDELREWAVEYDVLYKGAKENEQVPSLSGIVFRPHLGRVYPEKELASNIIGFVNRKGFGFGIEQHFNDLLAGEAVAMWVPTDPNEAGSMPYIPPGDTLILTIDREIQAAVEQILDQALISSGAEAGTILVMDPKTGEMLAMASTPRLDLNEFWKYGQVFPGSTPFNKAIGEDYEPGSVFKVLTMAAALDSGTVTPESTFFDSGYIEVGGVGITNWDHGAYGWQTMQGCMQHSLNVCLASLAVQMGPTRFYSYMQAFGMGHLTGIDISGEVTGRLKEPGDDDWYDSDLGTNAFGQGVSATALQMITAISAIANDGRMMAPHVLRGYVDKGYQYNIAPQVLGIPVSAKTAHDLTEMLAASLEEESSNALVEGYRVAGKTGTAEIPTPSGYVLELTNASFVGWGPTDDPRFVVYVWLERPTTSRWGSEVAAPVFSEVVKRLVVLMNLPPDQFRQQSLGAASGNH